MQISEVTSNCYLKSFDQNTFLMGGLYNEERKRESQSQTIWPIIFETCGMNLSTTNLGDNLTSLCICGGELKKTCVLDLSGVNIEILFFDSCF